MYLTEDDAAAIYAQACRSWYGSRASHVVKDQIKRLQKAGDERGVQAWSRVADKLSHTKRPRKAREDGKLY
jgi:ribosomal protein L18E